MKKLVALLACFVLAGAIPVASETEQVAELEPEIAYREPTTSSVWRGPIRLPWYNEPGDPLGCPGAGPYKAWKKVVATRQSDRRFRCGDRVELRYGRQTVVARVADHFSEAAPSWVIFDAAARLNCDLLLPKRLRSKRPGGYASPCSTLSNVLWRKVE